MDALTILKQNFRPFYTIASSHSIYDAIKLMAARKTDALIVTEDDHPVGIFTERDVFRYYQRSEDLPTSQTKLIEVITGRLITVTAADNISTAIDMMIQSDIRHLPVVNNERILGILTLKDVVGCQIDLLTDEIRGLQNYIDDLHEAAQD